METEKTLLKTDERIDDLQRNNLKIIQSPGRFCFGMDAVLLSGFVHAKKGDKLLDMGTGTGILPILLSAKTECEFLTGLEIQEESADMAQRSVLYNHIEDRVKIVCGDIKNAENIFQRSSFDVITCNPPYMIGKHGISNEEEPKAIARHEIACTFDDVARAASALLKPGGHFFLVHRPFRLCEIMLTLSQYKLEPKRMRLVYPFSDREPNMVLLEAVKGAKSRMTVEKPLIIFKEKDVYTDEIKNDYGF
ncbi:MAG: tRNA1(Val) (adenine(37)-N6)-methyltransferase [Lachnospiraceae bacterium]|nr:tRNA1(Val) (adenine(37)-N6)-methyltransferase [Lachnospiraceae bacterium]